VYVLPYSLPSEAVTAFRAWRSRTKIKAVSSMFKLTAMAQNERLKLIVPNVTMLCVGCAA
jgi:hypothetical protein